MRLPVKGVTDPTEGAEDSRHAMRIRNTASEAIRLQHLVTTQIFNGKVSRNTTAQRLTPTHGAV